ncbi:hypothetical protein, partial [Cronobacter sakazakii]
EVVVTFIPDAPFSSVPALPEGEVHE